MRPAPADEHELEELAALVLARPPRPPSRIELFSSDGDMGPGIYPDGPPMVPAAGEEWTDTSAAAALDEVVAPLGDDGRTIAMSLFAKPPRPGPLADPGIRAALAVLFGTVGRTAADGFLMGGLAYGSPTGATRIVGTDEHGRRVVNTRYRYEHPALLAGALAHEAIVPNPPANNIEEVFGHGLLAMVHLQLIGRAPHLVGLDTELSRRMNSFAITLFNSRSPGSPRFRLRAPDGPGTIPGGAPGMQTPDFFSIPFTSNRRAVDPAATAPMTDVLAGIVGPPAGEPAEAIAPLLDGRDWLGEHLTDDQAGVDFVDDHLSDAWLPLAARVRVGVALSLLDLDEICDVTGFDEATAIVAFDLADAFPP